MAPATTGVHGNAEEAKHSQDHGPIRGYGTVTEDGYPKHGLCGAEHSMRR